MYGLVNGPNVNTTGFWATERAKNVFNANKSPLSINEKVYKEQQVCNYNWNYKEDFEKLFIDTDIKIHIIVGAFDGICGPIITMDWLNSLPGFKILWDAAEWVNTEFGQKKQVSDYFVYELVDDASHVSGMIHPELNVKRLKELISGI